MGRKEYLADLATAKAHSFPNVRSVCTGTDTSEISLDYQAPSHGPSGSVTLFIAEPSNYPKSPDWTVWSDSDAHPSIIQAVSDLPILKAAAVSDLIQLLSQHITNHISAGFQPVDDDDDLIMLHSAFGNIDTRDQQDKLDDNDDDSDDASDDFDLDGYPTDHGIRVNTHGHNATSAMWSARCIEDLKTAKAAGFKIGRVHDANTGYGSFVFVSCRIAKLSLPEEAMQAWAVTPHEYLILILRYPTAYQSLESLLTQDQKAAHNALQMRVCVGDSYRPMSSSEALRAFDLSNAQEKPIDIKQSAGLRETFMSRPLKELINTRFVSILKYRSLHRCDWAAAEQYYIDTQNAATSQDAVTHGCVNQPKQFTDNHRPADDTTSSLLDGDHFSAGKIERSLPLIAMQFLLRHFVQCTDFCLVCFRRMDNQIAAIKPYVCERSLCLYQYMTLGFGPNIEHEIIDSPFVVDTLVSFCYMGSEGGYLRNYPQGLNLKVPHPSVIIQGRRGYSAGMFVSRGYGRLAIASPQKSADCKIPEKQHSSWPGDAPFLANLDRSACCLHFTAKPFSTEEVSAKKLKNGDWVLINGIPGIVTAEGGGQAWHCKIIDTSGYPSVKISKPLAAYTAEILCGPTPTRGGNLHSPELSQPKSKPHLGATCGVPATDMIGNVEGVKVYPYSSNFDDLAGLMEKEKAIRLLLDLLPSVSEMRSYLLQETGRSLESWSTRINPASLALLRWIIASNRSCIVPVDELESCQDDQSLTFKLRRGEHRVKGMVGWMQFRFAMGSPDKEQTFIRSIKDMTASQAYPTLFAWHGSACVNWHSIVRHGLDFSSQANGRSYGHGCYHAKDVATSLQYSARRIHTTGWANSQLKIDTAIALNEIVNAPSSFVHSNPFYVVAQLEWIQTRYLFVRPTVAVRFDETSEPESFVPQDPLATATASGASRTSHSGGPPIPIKLPCSAIPQARNTAIGNSKAEGPAKKKRQTSKTFGVDATKLIDLTSDSESSDDAVSITTCDEDREFLGQLADAPPTAVACFTHLSNVSPFQPVPILDIPAMPLPSYATNQASKALQREYKVLLTTQGKHLSDGTIQEAGWHLDEDYITSTNNIYQWIVGLHSFPLDLPLGQDMKSLGVNSIVMELRFPDKFPFSPPFVRVVRPRFLDFNAGGGGHVTAGGSICTELLTPQGWLPSYSIESLLLQIRLGMTSREPHPARLLQAVRGSQSLSAGPSSKAGGEYGVAEAVQAYIRACQTHGWPVSAELKEMVGG